MKRETWIKTICTLFMIIFVFSMILPFFWMISTSMKVETDVFEYPIRWIPKRWNAIYNYKTIFSEKYNFTGAYLNSIKVTVIGTALNLFLSAVGAYGFSKVNFKGRDKVFLLYLATVMIPPQVMMVPRFMLLRWLKIYDTHFALIIMGAFSVYGVFLLRQFMVSIPNSISESAKIDGASHFTIFLYIILPMTKPALATLGILRFVWSWNDYQGPLIFLSSRHLNTIQLALKQFSDDYGTEYSLLMAGSVIAIIPLFIVFFIGQKHIISGMTVGAVKG